MQRLISGQTRRYDSICLLHCLNLHIGRYSYLIWPHHHNFQWYVTPFFITYSNNLENYRKFKTYMHEIQPIFSKICLKKTFEIRGLSKNLSIQVTLNQLPDVKTFYLLIFLNIYELFRFALFTLQIGQ